MSTPRRSFLKALATVAAALALWLERALPALAQEIRQAIPQQDPSAALLRALARETGVSVLRDRASLAAAAEDYGHLTRGSPAAVACPQVAAQVEQAIAFANRRSLRLTPRGVGHSQSGHAVAPAGAITLDLSRLTRIEPPDPVSQTIVCEPGARWREVVAAAGAQELIPRVLPLYLDLTVGGTLSVGGIGTTAHRFGPAVANVVELEVVTGEGRRLRCAPGEDLFQATLASAGRCAVITSARLALRRIKPQVRTFYLLYDSIAAWLQDQRTLAQADRCDYLEGFCSASLQGLRNTPAGRRPFAHWLYGLHVSFEHEPGSAPEADTALAGLHHYRLVHTEDDSTLAFAARYDSRFEMMRRTGAMQQAHPVFECILPVEAIAVLLPRVLDMLPLSLGDGHRLIFLATRNLPEFFAVPSSREVACFAVLPTGVPAPLVPDTLQAIRAVHELLIEAGGKRYLPGWLGMMDEAAWRTHYGERYEEWRAAKRRFDPKGVLSSTLFPTAA